MKINVTPEGRPNIYIPEKESLKEYIKSKGFKQIHNFKPTSFAMLGADHDVESVLKDIDRAERIAIFTDNSNMGHSLALIIENKLSAFDIGTIGEEDLHSTENPPQ